MPNQADLARKELREAQEFNTELQKIAGQYEQYKQWKEHPITKALKDFFDTRHKQFSDKVTKKKCVDWNDYLNCSNMIEFYEGITRFCEGLELLGQAVIAQIQRNQNGNK